MLSNIQVFLNKNRKWLFGFLLIVIVVPFVFTVGSMPGLVSGKRMKKVKLFGYDLSNQKQLEDVVRNGALSVALATGNEENAWMESAQGYSIYRLLLLSIARDVRLPAPSETQLEAFIKTRPLFWDKEGKFKPELYNTYLANWKQRFGQAYSLRKLLSEDCLCDQVRNLMMRSGFVLPNETETVFKHIKASYDLDYIVVKNTEKAPEKIHENQLVSYYAEHKSDYQVGQRADVSLLFFDNKKYANRLPSFTDAELLTYFNNNKSKFKTGETDPEFQAVKDRVKTALETEYLSQLSIDDASKFVLDVYDKNIALNSEQWERWLDQNDVRCIHSIEPFTQDAIPSKKGLPSSALSAAFQLNEDHYLGDPVAVKNGTIVVVLNKFLPPYLPEMDAVREKVKEDVKNAEIKKAFDRKVAELGKVLQSATFKETFEANGLQVLKLENFSLESGFLPLSKLLSINAIFPFLKNLDQLTKDKWTSSYEGLDNSVVFFVCRNKSVPKDILTSEEFKIFQKNYPKNQQGLQSETLLREMLENTMNNSGLRR